MISLYYKWLADYSNMPIQKNWLLNFNYKRGGLSLLAFGTACMQMTEGRGLPLGKPLAIHE